MSTPITLDITVATPIALTLVIADPVVIATATTVTAPEADPIFQAWAGDPATSAEVNAGTITGQYISPAALAGSYYQRIVVSDTAPADTTLLWFDTSI